ncbi:MAG: GGDEF domain-containing protein [Rhizobacter sp.]|nr:GGDEF domain-containing protein [Rhizobacter sp.]
MTRRLTLARTADLVLTTRPRTRAHLGLWLTSVITYLLYIVIMWVQVGLGYTTTEIALRLMAATTVANACFYVGIRNEWGPQWDRTLGLTQLLVGIVFMWITYAISGPVAAATVIIVASHIVYAMFAMPPRQVWQLVVFSLVGLAGTMVVSHQLDPARYPPGEQLISFLYIVLVVVLIARLAAIVARMNEGLRSQSRELAAALEKVRQLATRDDLTQVHNRRHITELMAMEQNQHERSGSPLCAALLDIDLFKSVNDNHGHQAGDDVLRCFAQATQAALRASDLLGRWGGEEFIVVFPDTTLAQARVALDRVREQVHQTDFTRMASGLRITFSAGLVQLGPGEKIEAAIERADQAMYRAKTSGRDCIVAEPAAAPAGTPTVLDARRA